MAQAETQVDVAIVGGGLAGLAAAALLGREGLSVALFERSRDLGGRALTTVRQGFHLNLGPHALYRTGAAMAVLRELDIAPRGGRPPVTGLALHGGRMHALPGGLLSLLRTSLVPPGAKLGLARLFARIGRLDARALARRTVREWSASEAGHPVVAQLVEALVRLGTYAHAPERLSAAAGLAQIQAGLAGGVLYVDGGWRTIVEALERRARAAGATLRAASRAVAVERLGDGWRLELGEGGCCEAGAVILAVPPAAATDLVAGEQRERIGAWAARAVAVRAACLDLGLSSLPEPRATFALGIDRPLYLSVHSAVAALAPPGAATVHVVKYLEPDAEADAHATEAELEELLDAVQPGWRRVVVERRFLPAMTVSWALPEAAAGGVEGRPGPEVPGAPGLYVVGDWVGPEGLLADAALASARAAARRIAAEAAARPRVA